jgi:hypothetical protein
MFLIDEKVMADNRALIAIYPSKQEMLADDRIKNAMLKYVGTLGAEELFLTVPDINNATTKNLHNYKKIMSLDADEKYKGDIIFKDNVFINKKLVVSDLEVTGSNTVIDTVNLTIEDNIIEINKNEAGSGISKLAAGVQINRGLKGSANILFDESKGKTPTTGAFILDINGNPVLYVYETGGLKAVTDIEAQIITSNTGLISKNTLSVDKATTLKDILTVSKAATFNDNVTIDKELTTTLNINTNGNINILDTYIGNGLKFGVDGMSIYTALQSNGTYGGRLDSTSTNNMYISTPAGVAYGLVFKNGSNPVFQIEGSGQVRTKGGMLIWDLISSTWKKPELQGTINSFSQVGVSGQASIITNAKNDSLNLVAGPGITMATDPTSNTITLSTGAAGASSGVYIEHGIVKEEVFTATLNQRTFTLMNGSYTPGVNSVQVYVIGVRQPYDAFVEDTNGTSITLVSGFTIDAGDKVLIAYRDKGSVDKLTGGFITYDNTNAYTEMNTADDMQKAIDILVDKVFYKSPTVSLSNNIGTVEKGSPSQAVTLSWTVNKAMSTISINQGIGTVTGTSAVTNTAVDITWTITVGDGKNTATSNTSVYFRNKRYWGVSAKDNESSLLTSADLMTLTNEFYSGSYAQSRSFDCTGGKYFYFAWPANAGTPNFSIGGLSSTAYKKYSLSFTNSKGFTENYNIYRSQFLQTGSGIAVTLS